MSEKIAPLKMSTLANNGGFALEYLSKNEIQKAKELLPDGIAFCEYIQEQSDDDDIKNRVKKVHKRLSELLSEEFTYIDGILTIHEIRGLQRFFNGAGKPYLRQASKDIKRFEAMKRVMISI